MSPDLDEAYALETPEDSVALYRDWAARYDETFADARGYTYPEAVAALLRAHDPVPEPVLDVGAGTGLVAAGLPGLVVDGLDISAEMLAVAGGKGLYRQRIEADLTAPLPIHDATYGAVISAGTFTHGHVGPVCLPELMRVARPGARFVLGVNARVFDQAGFGSAFARLVAEGAITPVLFREVPVYGAGAAHDHAGDTALAAVFERR